MGNQRLLQVSPSVRGHAALYFLKTFQETDGSLPITAAQRALLKTATHHLRRSKDRNYSTCPGIDGILKMMSLKQKFYALTLRAAVHGLPRRVLPQDWAAGSPPHGYGGPER